MQRAFASGACSAIQVTPCHDDTCHCPCMSSTATSALPASPESDMTAGTQLSGVCARAMIGTSRVTARRARLTCLLFMSMCPPVPDA